MKLALARQKYNPFGGAERFVDRALQSLRAQGDTVTLLTREWPGDSTGRNVRICNPHYITRKGRDAGFAMAVQKIIASAEFDLVQSHERIPGCALYRAGDGVHATWLERRARVQSPLGRMATALHPWHRYTLNAEAAMFRHEALRAVICNSDMVKRDIRSRFGIEASKLHVIHNGIDLDYFYPALREQLHETLRNAINIPANASLLLFVGSGFERKGLPALLRAMAAMANKDTHLAVVGHDKQQRVMENFARDLGVASRTRFVGGQLDVRPYYAAADVFALPTLYDPFPNAVLEALACGLPVLTSPDSGAAELITPACGVVVDALDYGAQAKALDSLIEASKSMRAAARTAAQTCSLESMAAKLTTLYATLVPT